MEKSKQVIQQLEKIKESLFTSLDFSEIDFKVLEIVKLLIEQEIAEINGITKNPINISAFFNEQEQLLNNDTSNLVSENQEDDIEKIRNITSFIAGKLDEGLTPKQVIVHMITMMNSNFLLAIILRFLTNFSLLYRELLEVRAINDKYKNDSSRKLEKYFYNALLIDVKLIEVGIKIPIYRKV